MRIALEIQRFNPEKDKTPHVQRYEVDADPTDRLLSVLMKIKRTQDPTLAFRKSCAHGVCGSDAMIVNGKARLACKTLIRDVTTEEDNTIRIEPLKALPVQRDLMVDQSEFFGNYLSVKPYQIVKNRAPQKERLQSPQERKKYDDCSNCILCASCYSACPVIQVKNPAFLGPAAIVQAVRFLDDSRDQGSKERLPQLDHPNGVWACEGHFECTRVCPRGIKITKHINLTKRKIRPPTGKD